MLGRGADGCCARYQLPGAQVCAVRAPDRRRVVFASIPLAVCEGMTVTLSDCAFRTARPGLGVPVHCRAFVSAMDKQWTKCMHTATDIIFLLRERASDYDVLGDERSEAVTACTPCGVPGP